MPFQQQSGPPAGARQVKELLGLLQEAGYTDFRDARGPMHFTQRQAGGRFTSDEATAFIEQLQAEAERGLPLPTCRARRGSRQPSRLCGRCPRRNSRQSYNDAAGS